MERGIDLSELPVRDTDLEEPRFIDPEKYVDTAVNWREFDYVLVGTPKDVIGVLTVADVLGRLNDFAEAFVLLFEIEHSIRDLILAVYSGDELEQVFEGLSDTSGSPLEAAANGLQALLQEESPVIADKKVAKTIQFAANILARENKARPIESLKDFTFHQYSEVIFNKKNWPRFEEVFATSRDLLQMKFETINDLRNDVFHFRRAIMPRDTDKMRRFRDRIRNDHELLIQKRKRS